MDATFGRSGLGAFRLAWTVFVVAATSIPYLLNWLSPPAGSQYTWIMPPYPDDSLAYRAWSEQAAHGSLLFQMKYTALPHAPFLFHPFFLIGGWISALMGCDIGVVLWVLKAAGVVLFFMAFFMYTDDLRLSGFQSILATVLVGVSSGFGGLLVLFGLAKRLPALSADLWVVDSNTLWSLLWNPLFPWSLALMLFAIHRLERGTRERRTRDLWQSGLATGAMVLIHPYSLPLLLTLAVVLTVLRRRAETPGYLARYAIPVLPTAAYVASIAAFHPVVSRHSAQGAMQSPALSAYVLGFGLPMLLVVGGLAVARARLVDRHWPVILWFVLSLVFSYLPLWYQRKFIFGAHIPLCILAGVSVDSIVERLWTPPRRRRALLVAAMIGAPFLVATPVYLLGSELKEATANADGAYFIDDELMEGLKYLEARTVPDSVVFATPSTSRLIPGFSGNTVVWGHWAMSVDRKAREEWFTSLFKEGSDWNNEKRSGEFWGTGIDYILADGRLEGMIERNTVAWQVILADADRVFANNSVVIYRHRARRPE